MSYVQQIFSVGTRYRAKQDFTCGPTSSFKSGEILVFERNSYSPYDNSFVYIFRSATGNELKEWWLHESQSREIWNDYFEVLDPGSIKESGSRESLIQTDPRKPG
jgi:hypothetical protein